MSSKNFTAHSLAFTLDSSQYPRESGTFGTTSGNVGATINGVPIIDFAWDWIQIYPISYTTNFVSGALQYNYNSNTALTRSSVSLNTSLKTITYNFTTGGSITLTYTEHSDYIEFEITNLVDPFGSMNEVRVHLRAYTDTTVSGSTIYKSGGGAFEDFATTPYQNGRLFTFHDSGDEYLFCIISDKTNPRITGAAPYVECRIYDNTFVTKPGYTGLVGNKFAMFAAKLVDCPAIISSIESNFGISPGIVEKQGSDNKENVLFAYDITESNYSTYIDVAKKAGIKKVMFLQEAWYNTLNNDLHTSSFSSLSSLQSVVTAFKNQGIDCGGHLFPNFITVRSGSTYNNILVNSGFSADGFMFSYPDHRLDSSATNRVKLNQIIASSGSVSSIAVVDARDGLQYMTSLAGLAAICQIGNEFFSFGSITRVSAGNYILNSVTRDLQGTGMSAHAINDLTNFIVRGDNGNINEDLLIPDPFKSSYKAWLNIIAQRYVNVGFTFAYLDGLEVEAFPLTVYPDTETHGLTLFDTSDVFREFCASVKSYSGTVQFIYGSSNNGHAWHHVSRTPSIDYNHYGISNIDSVGSLIISGTATSGSSNTITLNSSASNNNDAYIRRLIYIESGTGSGQWAYITSYNGSTKVATISTSWSTPPNGTSVYSIHSNTDSSGFSLLQKHVNEISIAKNITKSFKTLFIPSDFGWYRPTNEVIPTLWEWDAFEANYLMSKVVGNDSVLTLSWNSTYNIKNTDFLLDIIKQWHTIKLNGTYGSKVVSSQDKTNWSTINSTATSTPSYFLLKSDAGYIPQQVTSMNYLYPLSGYSISPSTRGLIWTVGSDTPTVTLNINNLKIVDYQGITILSTGTETKTFVVNTPVYFYTSFITVSSLHGIGVGNVFFCYRSSDAQSIDVANYYSAARGIPQDNLIPLPCSDDLIISKADYVSTIENPIITAIANSIVEIYVIILGFNVPNSFIDDDGEIIACASRLHRIGHEIDRKHSNHTYDRKDFKYFDQSDSTEEKICAVLDGPDQETVIDLIDRGVQISKQSVISGKLFIDPYGKTDTAEQVNYQNDLALFSIGKALDLGLEIVSTQEPLDPYLSEPMIIGLNNDSFYWGWYQPRYSKSLFYSTNAKRTFLYNADNDSASNIRQPLGQSDPWCCLAMQIKNGYAACAGAVSSPDEDAYLRPEPFFDALHQGSTLGEAFLFSSQFVDWKLILVGDPLITVNFPTQSSALSITQNTFLDFKEAIRLIMDSLSETIAWRHRQTKLTNDIENYIIDQNCLEEEHALFKGSDVWSQAKGATVQTNMLYPLLKGFLQFMVQSTALDFSSWINDNDLRVSPLLVDEIDSVESQEIFSSSQLLDSGSWNVEFKYLQTSNVLQRVFFALDVATDPEFNDIIITADTRYDRTGWEYEFSTDTFLPFPQSGFPSNYANVRRIRYTAPKDNYLTTLEVYYMRWLAYDTNDTLVITGSDDSGYHCIGRNYIVRN